MQVETFNHMIHSMNKPTLLYRGMREKGQIITINDCACQILKQQGMVLTEIEEQMNMPHPFTDKEWSIKINNHIHVHIKPLVWNEQHSYYLATFEVEGETEIIPGPRTLFQKNSDAIFIFNTDGCLIEFNERAKSIAGYDRDAIKGKHFEFLLSIEEERKQIRTYFDKSLQGQVQVFKATLRTPSSQKCLYVVMIPFIENDKVTCVYGIAKEETSEQVFRNLLMETENKYKTIVEHSYDLICFIDPLGQYKLASKSYDEILGYHPQEMIVKNVLDLIHPHDQPRIQMVIKRMIETKESCEGLMYRKLRADGTYQLFEGRGTPVIDTYGTVQSFVFISRDLSKVQEGEELMRKTEKLAIVGELAAGIAHEIRNPLTTVKGFLELSANKLGKYETIILQELKQIDDTVEELLLVARPRHYIYESVSVRKLVEESVQSVGKEAWMKHVSIRINGSEQLRIHCVKHQMVQVLINFYKNAIEAIEEEGVIHTDIIADKNDVIIKIKDNGCGMSQSQIKKLGEPFYSTKGRGAGIGLMVCYKVIENHHGELNISSELNVGTLVTIRLPIHDAL